MRRDPDEVGPGRPPTNPPGNSGGAQLAAERRISPGGSEISLAAGGAAAGSIGAVTLSHFHSRPQLWTVATTKPALREVGA